MDIDNLAPLTESTQAFSVAQKEVFVPSVKILRLLKPEIRRLRMTPVLKVSLSPAGYSNSIGNSRCDGEAFGTR